MAENIQDIEPVADVDAAADMDHAYQDDFFRVNQDDFFEDIAQTKLEAAYDKIMDTISGGYFEGSNAELLEKSGVRDIFGEEYSDSVSVRLVTGDGTGSEYYKEVLGDSWDGESPILVVDPGWPDGLSVYAVPAQELYDFVNDDSRNDKLSQDSGEGGDVTRHEVNYMDGVTDSYRTTVETEDGKSVEICTDLVETWDGYQWETMAFTYDEDGNRVSIEDTYCDRCDRSEDPTSMHESAVEYMKEYSGDFVDMKENSDNSAVSNDDRGLAEKLEDAVSTIIDKISSAVSEIIGGLIEELKGDVSNDDDKMDAQTENDAQDKAEQDVDEGKVDDGKDTPIDIMDENDTDNDQDNLNNDDEDWDNDWGNDSVD